MAAATRPPQRRKMFVPPEEPIVVVQPPEHLAHLTGDALFEALITDRSERWYSNRAAAECGRALDTMRGWVSERYTYDSQVKAAQSTSGKARPVRRPAGKMAPTPDGYDVRSPWWYAGTMRAWFIKEGLMARDGKFVPYKPTGRTPGSTNSTRRQSPTPMTAAAAAVLAAYDELLAAGKTTAQAVAELAQQRGETERQIIRKLTTGRKLRADQQSVRVTPDMSADEITEQIRKARALLTVDGRRRNEDKIRYAITVMLGLDRDTVDQALGGPAGSYHLAEGKVVRAYIAARQQGASSHDAVLAVSASERITVQDVVDLLAIAYKRERKHPGLAEVWSDRDTKAEPVT